MNEDIFRSGALGALIPPAPASLTAQSASTGGPLNIRHIKRAHGFAHLTGQASDLTISSTSWAEAHPVLALEIATSDRPLLMEATVTTGPGTTSLAFSFALDGAEVTNATYGLAAAGVTGELPVSIRWVAQVTPGTHRVALVTKALAAGTGTIYCVNDVAVIAAREV